MLAIDVVCYDVQQSFVCGWSSYTVSRQRTTVTNILEYDRKVEWKYVGHIVLMKDNRLIIRYTKWHVRRDVI